VAVGRVTVNRVEHRALGLAVLLRCSHSSYQIHGSLHGPRSCGLVRGDTAHRTTGCPVCLTCATCTSRCLLPLAPHCFKRLGPAPRTAAPRGRAPSATRMWSAGLPDGPAAGRHAFAHCHGLRVTTGSLPHSSLESASVSVAAVTSTVAYAGAGCT